MNREDNENKFYVLKEENEEQDLDVFPRNFASYDEDLEESEEIEERRSAFGLLMHVMFNPVEGWKRVRRSGIKTETLQAGCFYPLLAILSLSKFADYFYSVNVSFIRTFTEAVVAFVSFFFSYFCIQMAFSLVFPATMKKKIDTSFGKVFILISLSTLVLFSILTALLPMLWPILFFLPIWTMYLMFKGTRFFKFQQNEELKFFGFSVVVVIGMPLLIDWALNSLLPY